MAVTARVAGMLGMRERWRSTLLFAAVGVLVAVGAGVGNAGGAEQLQTRSSAVVSATPAIGLGTGGVLDTRVQRPPDAGPRHRTTHHDGLGGPVAPGRSPQPWARTLAGILERAGHPERLGQILLRGPPGPSA